MPNIAKKNMPEYWKVVLLKNGPYRAIFLIFSVFSNKQYNLYNKLMWKNVHPVSGAGIQTSLTWVVSRDH